MPAESRKSLSPRKLIEVLLTLVVMTGIAIAVAAWIGTPWEKILGVTAVGTVIFGLGLLNALSRRFQEGKYIERALTTYFTFCFWMMLAFVPSSGLLWLNRIVLERLVLLPQVVIFSIWGLLLAVAVGLVSTDSKRHRLFSWMEKKVGVYSPLVYSFNLLIIALIFFSSVTYVLAIHGKMKFAAPSDSPVSFEKLQNFYLWHFVDALPLLGVTETLKWTNPLTYDNGFVGFALLVFKLTVIIPVIASFAYYWKNYGKPDTSSDKTLVDD